MIELIPYAIMAIIVFLILIILVINSTKGKKKDRAVISEPKNINKPVNPPVKKTDETKLTETDVVNLPQDNTSDLDIQAEIEKLKLKKQKETQVISDNQNATDEPKQRFARQFLPVEDTKYEEPPTPEEPVPPTQSAIPDKIFSQTSVPKYGLLSLPNRLMDVNHFIGCVIYDKSGLPLAFAAKEKSDKYKLSAYSSESMRIIKKMGNIVNSDYTWYSAWLEEHILIVISKQDVGCTILLDKKTDHIHISNLVKTVVNELTTYSPKEY